MDGAVEVKGSRCIKRANGLVIVAIKLNIDLGRAIFCIGLRRVILPGPICNDMYDGDIIDDIDLLAFMDSDRGGFKGQFFHMDAIGEVACVASRSASREERGDCAAKEEERDQLFHSSRISWK